MISISAVSYHGDPVAPLAAGFDAAGGSIGRAGGNRLTLPDPDRTISRVHAEIVHRGIGAFAVVNRGANPITLNGRSLDSGAEAAIGTGDELVIGAYVLRVDAAVDAPARASAGAGGIPDDWDPFAAETSAAAMPRSPPSPSPSPSRLPPRPASSTPAPTPSEGSLDALFGLTPAAGGDALAGWGQSAPVAGVVPPSPSPAPAPTPAPAPRQPPSAVVPPLPKPLADASPTEHAAPAGSVLSWTLATAESTTTIGAGAGTGTGAAAGAAEHAAPGAECAVDLLIADEVTTTVIPARREPAPAPGRAGSSFAAPAWRPPGAEAPVEPRLAAAPAPAAEFAELTQAWHDGLAAQGLPPEALKLTPALMRLLGRLLREAARGTIDLLAARAALKREIRAEVTMIVARENNPLKFSASADVALAHLLGAPERGFMPGDLAMRDAYEDLRAHQFATLAGMRAALEGIFTRFDPAVLEAKLTQASLLDSLLPSSRKARMWDLFQGMYTQLAAEASDDFHELFGKAFLRAYEEHIAQLAKDRE